MKQAPISASMRVTESLIAPFSTKRFTLFYLHNTVILEPFTAKNSCSQFCMSLKDLYAVKSGD